MLIVTPVTGRISSHDTCNGTVTHAEDAHEV